MLQGVPEMSSLHNLASPSHGELQFVELSKKYDRGCPLSICRERMQPKDDGDEMSL